MLRPSIMAAPGHTFVCGDGSHIEARVLPWLSDNPAAQSVLDTFAHCDSHPDDPDIYELQAALMNVPDRQIGKVAVLSLGYEGGRKAFTAMARNYGLVVDEKAAENYKNAWRNANPWAPAFWADCNTAATSAIKLGGEWPAGRVVYAYDETWDTLTAALPTGGVLYYPKPRIEPVDTPWGETRPAITAIKASWKPAAGQDAWPRVALYGGMFAQGATQGAAADILKMALKRLVDLDWPVVGHTHDEILLEARDDEVDEATEALQWAMLQKVESLPLAASVWRGPRYRK
jgi:DNA polymerase